MLSLKKIDGKRLLDCLGEVIALTLISMFPLIAAVCFGVWWNYATFSMSLRTLVSSLEIYSLCLGFIAPVLYNLAVKANGKSYRVPLYGIFILIYILVYVMCFSTVILTKADKIRDIDKPFTPLLGTSIVFFIVIMVLRIYSSYHTKMISMKEINDERAEKQANLNSNFVSRIKKGQQYE